MGRTKLYDDEVLVVGLGRFGAAAALELAQLGHRVTAIERDARKAESFNGRLHRVLHADASMSGVLDKVRARDFKHAVVGIGGSVESSVLVAASLVDAGIPGVWAKANSAEHAWILERIGVRNIIRPESESGQRVAHLVNGRLEDYIEFDDGFAIVKMAPPQETVGFTLEQSRIRSKYGVTVVGVKSPGQDFTYAVPSTRVTASDTLIVSGPVSLIERLAERP